MKKPNLLTNWIFSFVVLAGTSFSVLSKEAAIIDPTSRFHPVYGSVGDGSVTRDCWLVTVGAEILSQGGNAIDAAVATGFASGSDTASGG